VSVNFQFLQKTHFKSPRSGADHLFTNVTWRATWRGGTGML